MQREKGVGIDLRFEQLSHAVMTQSEQIGKVLANIDDKLLEKSNDIVNRTKHDILQEQRVAQKQAKDSLIETMEFVQSAQIQYKDLVVKAEKS